MKERMKVKNKFKESKEDKIFGAIVGIALFILFIIFVYPLYFVIIASFSSSNQVLLGNVILLPKDITLTGYQRVFSEPDVWLGYGNSLFYTGVGVTLSLILSTCAAYPMSRTDFRARGIITFLYTVTMFFNGGLIPLYLLVKNLNLLNTMWSFILPTAMSVYNIIVMRTYFNTTIPKELLEASKIDGCSNIKFMLKIVVPLSKPILAVMALFYASSRWNEFYYPLMFVTERNKFPLQVFLREFLIQAQMTADMAGDATISYAQHV